MKPSLVDVMVVVSVVMLVVDRRRVAGSARASPLLMLGWGGPIRALMEHERDAASPLRCFGLAMLRAGAITPPTTFTECVFVGA